ncbi:MAG: hypothetical protein V4754_17600 [Pseudomonadota bacterium]
MSSSKKAEPLAYLDMAWPDKEVVRPIDPKPWRYVDLDSISEASLAIGQIRDLETDLNQHCVDTDGIDVLHMEMALSEHAERDDYVPYFTVGTGDDAERIAPDFPIDLICLAEGGKSKNLDMISGQTSIPTNESWFQANYVAAPGLTSGSSLVLSEDNQHTLPQVAIRINRPHDSLINMASYVKRDQADGFTMEKFANRAQDFLKATGATADAADEHAIEYKSTRIDTDLRRLNNPIRKNVVAVGDSAGSASSVAGMGASLAMSAYPEAIHRLVEHMGFRSHYPGLREQAERQYRVNAGKAVSLWQNKSTGIMRRLDLYTPEVQQAVFEGNKKFSDLPPGTA